MPVFQCRMVIPEIKGDRGNWISIETATPEEAANNCHCDLYDLGFKGFGFADRRDGKITLVHFARIEVEGHDTWVSRIFYRGIYRKGGVRAPGGATLDGIAKKLGWERPPETLLEEGWDCEESWDDAQVRESKCAT